MSSKIDRAILGSLEFPKGYGTTLANRDLDFEKPCCGLDTEADAITAEPFLLTYDNGIGEPQYLHINEPKRLLDFFSSHKFRETINFFYNLQYDFEGMLKKFPKEIAVMIFGKMSCDMTEDCKFAEEKNMVYRVSYIPKKAFHIKVKGHKKYSYYDLLQYFQTSLENASQSYLGAGKEDFKAKFTSKGLFQGTTTIEKEIERFRIHILSDSDDNKIERVQEMVEFFNRFESPEEYRKVLLHYALIDAKRCRQLGEIIVKGINGFVNTRNFNSSATISEYYFRSNGIHVPKLPTPVFKKFMQPYFGGRFEITKKGAISGVSMYDIKSAYPWAMAQMPILSKNPVSKNVYNMTEKALYGSYCINIKIDENLYLSPLAQRTGLLTFPVGEFTNYWVDKVTLQLLNDLGFKYHMIKGIEIYDENADYRLAELINKLFAIKEDKSNAEVVRTAAKIILNSLYGKFIQLVDDAVLQAVTDLDELEKVGPSGLFNVNNTYYKRIHNELFRCGKLFAPQYASFITSFARAHLYKTAWKVGLENIVGFHTDSIMMQNGVLDESSKLGGWELEMLKDKTGRKVPARNVDLQLFKTGMYEVKADGLKKLRARGVGKTDTLLKESFTVSRRYGLRQAVRRDFDNMNVITREPLANNINSDMKRNWHHELTIKNVEQGMWTDSSPLVI